VSKLLLIGQAPSRTSDPRKPLEGEPLASKLCALFGCTRKEYLAKTERHNVLQYWPGKKAKGDELPWLDARRGAERLRKKLLGRRVVFIGQATAAYFYNWGRPLRWERAFVDDIFEPFTKVAILPHPSGINRWWNDPANRRRAKQFMRRAWRCVR
jgi:hypothetical protein